MRNWQAQPRGGARIVKRENSCEKKPKMIVAKIIVYRREHDKLISYERNVISNIFKRDRLYGFYPN